MAIEVRHGPDLQQVANVARAIGAAKAARSDAQFAAQLEQRDRHFYDQIGYGMVSDEQARADADQRAILQDELARARQADADASGLERRQQELQLQHEYGILEAEQQAEIDAREAHEKYVYENFEYSPQQRRDLKDIQTSLDRLPRLKGEGWTDEQIAHARTQIEEKQRLIKPSQLKTDPLGQFPKTRRPGPDGIERDYYTIPGAGRNGTPLLWTDDPTAPDAGDVAKQQSDRERIAAKARQDELEYASKESEALQKRIAELMSYETHDEYGIPAKKTRTPEEAADLAVRIHAATKQALARHGGASNPAAATSVGDAASQLETLYAKYNGVPPHQWSPQDQAFARQLYSQARGAQ